jgi:hypothetical protein
MLRTKKAKFLSLLVTIGMLASMFIMPLSASAATPVYPVITHTVPTDPILIQVANNGTVFNTFPAAANSSPSYPTLVFIVTSATGATVSATDFTPSLAIMDPTFQYPNTTSITSAVGTYDAQSGVYSGGTVFYAKSADTANVGTNYYYKVVAFSPASANAALTSITDITNLANPINGIVAGGVSTAAGTVTVIPTATLLASKTSIPQTAIVKTDPNSTVTVWTDAACATAAPANLVAGVYYIKVIAQDGTTIKYWKLTISNATSTDTKLIINPKNAVVSGNNSSVSNLGSVSAATNYVALPTGSYTISNLNGELYSINSTSEVITSSSTVLTPFSTGIAGTPDPLATFSKTITTGDKLTITVVVTAADTTTTATHVIVYRVYDKGISGVGSGMPSGTISDPAQYTNVTAGFTPETNAHTINLSLPVGTSTIASLSSAFNYYGTSIDFSSALTAGVYDTTKIITSLTVPQDGVTIYSRVRTNALVDPDGNVLTATYIYYKLVFARTADANIIVKVVAGSTATVTDNALALVSINNTDTTVGSVYGGKFDTSIASGDPGYLGLNDSTHPFTINLTVNAPSKLRAILANLAYTTAGSSVNPTYTNLIAGVDPYLAFGTGTTINATVTTEAAVTKYFTIIVSVVSTNKNAVIASIDTALGASTIVAGNLDPTTPSTLTITAPTTITAINSSAFTAADFGTFRLFANAADVTDNTKAVSSVAVASATNSATAYASVTSGNGLVVRYFAIVVNKVDAATKYQVTTPGFVTQGTNQVATVTIDRAVAAKLAAPKLFVSYTLSDGSMVFQTLDIAMSNSTATAQIVCGVGITSIQAFVVDGLVDWSVGTPAKKSTQFLDLTVPVI